MYAVCIVILFLVGGAAAQEGPGLTFGSEEFDSQPINLYFYSGEEGGLAVEEPQGNTTAEVECQGHPTPRVAGYYIGTWASRPMVAPVDIDRQVSCGLWTYSDEQASNVHFNAEVLINGNELFQFTTESANLGTKAQEIKGSGQSEEPIQLVQGDIISVRLAYFSDPRIGIGPGADSTLIVGDEQYDTHITVTASPLTLEIQEPEFEGQCVVISAYINDSFASTRYYTEIGIIGKTDAETISEPEFAPEGNTTLVTWIWDSKADGAKDGEYRVSISVAYSEDTEFTAMETYAMEFLEPEPDSSNIISALGWQGWLAIAAAVVSVVAVSYWKMSTVREK
jgi:hypothetical protein